VKEGGWGRAGNGSAPVVDGFSQRVLVRMPADVFPQEVIEKIADQVDLPMLKMLRRIENEQQIMSDDSLPDEDRGTLDQLAKIGLVDPGYTDGKPWNWLSNSNGRRMLEHFHRTKTQDDDAPPEDRGTWLS